MLHARSHLPFPLRSLPFRVPPQLDCGILSNLLDCGILSDLVLGAPDAPRYVFWDGKLRPIPSGPADLISSDLLTLAGKLRAALGFVGIRPPLPAGSKEESVSEFVTRNLGSQLLHRLVDPFCSCIFAGDAEQMSMQAAFNRIWRMEAEGGSLLGGMIQLGKERKEKQKDNPAEPRDPSTSPHTSQLYLAPHLTGSPPPVDVPHFSFLHFSYSSFHIPSSIPPPSLFPPSRSLSLYIFLSLPAPTPPPHPPLHPLPIPLSLHPPLHPPPHPPLHPSLHPPLHPSLHPPLHPSLHPPLHPSLHPTSPPPSSLMPPAVVSPGLRASQWGHSAQGWPLSQAPWVTGRLGSRVRVGWRLVGMQQRAGGGAVLTYDTPRGTTRVAARSVLLTVPAYVAADVIRAFSVRTTALPSPPQHSPLLPPSSKHVSYPPSPLPQPFSLRLSLCPPPPSEPTAAAALAAIPYPPMASVALSYPAAAVREGTGWAGGLVSRLIIHLSPSLFPSYTLPPASSPQQQQRSHSSSSPGSHTPMASVALSYPAAAPTAAAALAAIPYPPMASVALSYPAAAVREGAGQAGGLRGYGQLHPRSQELATLGCIYSSALFPNRAPDGRVVFICYVGGAGNDAVAEMSHTDLIAAVDRDMRTTLLHPSAPPPLALGVRVWPRAVPQLNIGHLARIEAAKTGIEEAEMEGVFLGGNYLTGVALSCLSQVSLSGEAKSSHVAQRHVASRRGARCDAATAGSDGKPRVRFAPSPTGNLHVGGARTALFNWLFARATGGKFVLRVEDTDLNRSTPESEAAMVRDLRWLGLDWDEGPDVGGPLGPYRQSERNEIYRELTEKLLASGMVYRCFCTDEELAAMKAEQEAKKLPPKYAGKWARASEDEVAAELAKGTPHSFRFRVPPNKVIKINDLVRGEVAWNTDTLGDFVVLRSNGQPVYNFCVTVDDATMKISHVIRAEEHLPNTLRQALIYEALGLPMPTFGHVSLILAPDRSKLSKRHGATSVGQFKELGFLPEAMVNYLALLGWNDGTEDEIFTPSQLVEKFSLSRVTKSAAIFDNAKLRWINGQHFRQLSEEASTQLLAEQWHASGLLASADATSRTTQAAASLVRNGLELVTDADAALEALLAFPLKETLASEEAKAVVEDGLDEVRAALLAEWESGALLAAVDGGAATWKKWIKGFGKATGRKGKRLFMPIRVLLTGCMHGPDVGETLTMLQHAAADKALGPKAHCVGLEERISILRDADLTAAPDAAEAVAASVAQ
ncbi:unnamed protein product [Closterium sp. Naga37s-1]|nr:unnamed protein product [Closterium sp. Naga37s-1]